MTARVPYVLAWDELKLLQRLGWELVWDDRGSTMCITLATSLLFFVASLGTTWAKMRCVPSSKLFEVLVYQLCWVSFLDVCSIQ